MRSVGAAITAALPLEQTKAVIALILFALNSSANAMTVIFKDYKAATSDERAFYYLYLDGVREGIIELNGVLEEKRQQPLFCLHEKLALTIEQVEDIMMRQAEKITDLDWTYSRARFCKKRFPVTKSISRQCAMAGGNKQTNQMFVPIGSCQITSQVWFFGNAN